MSRIRAVDNIFADIDRIYVNPMGEVPPGAPVAHRHNDKVIEYRLNLLDEAHHQHLEDLVLRSRFIYVHTLHLARYVLPFYPTGKIVTDMHGIAPEEERMLDRNANATFYEGVETAVLSNSHIVVVTDAMRRHLLAKHPEAKSRFTVLPIIELHPVNLSERKRRTPENRYRAIYAGGTQPWQNIDLMLDIADRAADFCDFTFLSHEYAAIRARATGRPLERVSTFSVANKEELPSRYLDADFGFVLRDDNPVNRVACPTKLTEYLWFGVVPVVKSPEIGDFPDAGYAYVTADEFADGVIPDEETAQKMRENNRAIIDRLLGEFHTSAESLRRLKISNAIRTNTLAGLAIARRHLLFPNQAELYLFGESTRYFSRDIIEPNSTLTWTPGVGEPARTIRVIPIVADATVKLVALDIDVEGNDLSAVQVRCTAPGIAQSGGVRLRKAQPFFEVQFSRPLAIRSVQSSLKFIALDTIPASADTEDKPPQVTISLRDVRTGSETKSVVDIACDC